MKILRTIEDRGQEPLLPHERVKETSLSAKSSATAGFFFFAFKGGIRKLVVSLVNNALLAELSPTIVKAYFPVAQQPW